MRDIIDVSTGTLVVFLMIIILIFLITKGM